MGKLRLLIFVALCILMIVTIKMPSNVQLILANKAQSSPSKTNLFLPLVSIPSVKNTPPLLPPRRGIAPDNFDQLHPQISQLADWSFRWSAYDGEYPTNNQHELVPMLVFSKGLPTPETIRSIDRKTDLNTGHDYWLVFNECEVWIQCGTAPEKQARFFHDEVLPLINAHDPDARLIIGGIIANEKGLAWLTTFLESYRALAGQDLPRAGWHFHIYPEVDGVKPSTAQFIASAERFQAWVNINGKPEDEVWLTEMGCLSQPLCKDVPNYLADILAYLNGENGRWITRYAWYTSYSKSDCYACSYNPETFQLSESYPHELTELGRFYANHSTQPAIYPRAAPEE